MSEFFRGLGKKLVESLKPKEQTPGFLLEIVQNQAARAEAAFQQLGDAVTNKKWTEVDRTDFKLMEILLAVAEINAVGQGYITNTNNRQTVRVRQAYQEFQAGLRQSMLFEVPAVLEKLAQDIKKIEELDQTFRKP